jgi:hypothetical protein
VSPEARTPTDYDSFVKDPLSRWIESTFGLAAEAGSGRLVRAVPRPISGRGGAAAELSRLAEVDEELCATRIKDQLLAGWGIEQPDTRFPVFAFRLHQFISRGDTVFVSLEGEDERYVTVHPQNFVPEDRTHLLFPLVFCRECGQEYYAVRVVEEKAGERLEARVLDVKADETDEASGLSLREPIATLDPGRPAGGLVRAGHVEGEVPPPRARSPVPPRPPRRPHR